MEAGDILNHASVLPKEAVRVALASIKDSTVPVATTTGTTTTTTARIIAASVVPCGVLDAEIGSAHIGVACQRLGSVTAQGIGVRGCALMAAHEVLAYGLRGHHAGPDGQASGNAAHDASTHAGTCLRRRVASGRRGLCISRLRGAYP